MFLLTKKNPETDGPFTVQQNRLLKIKDEILPTFSPESNLQLSGSVLNDV